MADAEEPAQGLAKAMARVGGTGDTKEADAEIQEICACVREEAQVAAQAAGWNGVFETFDPVCYTSQVVAGTNYFIKVRTSDAELVHIRVHKPLPHTGAPPQCAGIKLGETEDSDVAYF